MDIENQCIVSIHYRLTDDDGVELDSSQGKEPLVYLHGKNSLIPGLESQLNGKKAGDHLQVTVQPEDGYGLVNQELIQVVPRSAFEGIDEIKPGMQFEARGPDGHAQHIVVDAVGEEGITVNANHPLAGQVLHFDVTIEDVREATEEELAHGHAHVPGHEH